MKLLSKSLVCLLLLASMVPLVLTMHALAANPAVENHAGCHGSHHGVPPPAPVNYRCCQAGHNAAILQSASTPGPPFVYFAAVELAVPVAARTLDASSVSLTFSIDPSRLTPLRI